MTPVASVPMPAGSVALTVWEECHTACPDRTPSEVTPRRPAGSAVPAGGRRIVEAMTRHDQTAETLPAPVLGAVPPPLTTTPAVAAPALLLTAAEVAELLRIDPYTVRRYVKRGELPAYRVGRELRFDAADVRTYLAGRRQL